MTTFRLRRPLHALRVRPRLLTSLAVGLLVWFLLPDVLVPYGETRLLVAWNAFALLYLGLALHMAWQAGADVIRRRALQQDEGSGFVLVLVVLASVAVLLGIGSQLAVVKDLHGLARTRHVGLAALTVVSSWLFTQTLFALHYAHEFYLTRARKLPDGLAFPGTPDPCYSDFLYFACVIGTSGQTADVSFTSPAMRRVGLVHCVQAFFFNTTVLALTINIAAGLF